MRKSKKSKNDTERDATYKRYHENVNMSHREMSAWANNPCSKKASLSRGPVNRNLRLLKKKKSEWSSQDITDARKTIAFNSRMRKVAPGKPVKGCGLSKRDISLKNWAYDPRKR